MSVKFDSWSVEFGRATGHVCEHTRFYEVADRLPGSKTQAFAARGVYLFRAVAVLASDAYELAWEDCEPVGKVLGLPDSDPVIVDLPDGVTPSDCYILASFTLLEEVFTLWDAVGPHGLTYRVRFVAEEPRLVLLNPGVSVAEFEKTVGEELFPPGGPGEWEYDAGMELMFENGVRF